ncbi:hypothetical protein GDO86_009041 [Hymenochirus boettgeri]|uniref:Uncharacterized protein n=1 Tax=Hymenochirus boettgeri TaxID=247094 RepID=A0A8T2JMJ5_9PIPI|nr:hypothetical protein GDO86_009041 [Hymenochirus boettgeri]
MSNLSDDGSSRTNLGAGLLPYLSNKYILFSSPSKHHKQFQMSHINVCNVPFTYYLQVNLFVLSGVCLPPCWVNTLKCYP